MKIVPQDVRVSVHPAVAGLLDALPPLHIDGQEVRWPKKDREQFMHTLRAIIDLIYPEEPAQG